MLYSILRINTNSWVYRKVDKMEEKSNIINLNESQDHPVWYWILIYFYYLLSFPFPSFVYVYMHIWVYVCIWNFVIIYLYIFYNFIIWLWKLGAYAWIGAQDAWFIHFLAVSFPWGLVLTWFSYFFSLIFFFNTSETFDFTP